jgi:hypothetical protein
MRQPRTLFELAAWVLPSGVGDLPPSVLTALRQAGEDPRTPVGMALNGVIARYTLPLATSIVSGASTRKQGWVCRCWLGC